MVFIRRVRAGVGAAAARGALVLALVIAGFAADASRPAAAGFFEEIFGAAPGVRYIGAPAPGVTPWKVHRRHKLKSARRHGKLALIGRRHARKTTLAGALEPVVPTGGALDGFGPSVRQTPIRLHAAAAAGPAPHDRAAAARPHVAGQTVAAEDFLVDSTLRPGDVVVTSHGLRVFRGRAAPPHAFTSISESRDMPRAKQGALAAIDRVLRTPRKDALPLSAAPR